ncbi:CPBP family intramembrane metalloprotease [Oculatella sp. FACHB-28]|uniref:CPBP family intramembrane glutamic endopeptidase n=1 Tax=Cyanophyceae TaxID=3028117 RepID=UPI001681F015|nr:CPBP family intramembrane metalloprotease [Oculatella sp. FACHB-28]MBD2070809.1 CPBP family intramembrane metalloprotease [Leptolyngbya sp. FACHB-671]
MTEQLPQEPTVESLTRVQILVAMAVTAIILLLVARLWLLFDSVSLLAVNLSVNALLIGLGIGLGITTASAIVYRLWSSYQKSADYYLELVLKPLIWFDLIWLGLLPGLSEELLFRGVMLPAIGLNSFGVFVSSICFGVLHYSGSQQWAYVIWAAVIGGVLGISALETGNLLVPIVAHITTNLISSCMWKVKH